MNDYLSRRTTDVPVSLLKGLAGIIIDSDELRVSYLSQELKESAFNALCLLLLTHRTKFSWDDYPNYLTQVMNGIWWYFRGSSSEKNVQLYMCLLKQEQEKVDTLNPLGDRSPHSLLSVLEKPIEQASQAIVEAVQDVMKKKGYATSKNLFSIFNSQEENDVLALLRSLTLKETNAPPLSVQQRCAEQCYRLALFFKAHPWPRGTSISLCLAIADRLINGYNDAFKRLAIMFREDSYHVMRSMNSYLSMDLHRCVETLDPDLHNRLNTESLESNAPSLSRGFKK